jgi:hypothetical protein
MITAKEKLQEHGWSPTHDFSSDDMEDIAFIMREYARLVIAEDRANVAEHATTTTDLDYWESTSYIVVDKNSIINAPQIELK